MKDNQQLKQQLQKMQDELLARLKETQSEEREQVQADGKSDNAHLWEESDIRDGLDDEAATELRLVNKALARIETGDYGTCTNCHKAISQARLEAVPYAELCIDCS